jgi:hypothetical protein
MAKTKPVKKPLPPPEFLHQRADPVAIKLLQDISATLAKLLLIEEDRLQRQAMKDHQAAWGRVDKAKAVGVDISSPEFHRYMKSPPAKRKWWRFWRRAR